MVVAVRVRFLLLAAILLLLLTVGACGGGSSSTPPPPPPSYTVTALFGLDQTAPAGGTLSEPVGVWVQAADGRGVAGVIVTFSASAGVELFPTQVTTPPSGTARVMLRLPNTPMKDFTITARAGTLSADITAHSGPRIVDVFGNADSGPAIASDGRGFSQNAIFGADGKLQTRLGATLGRMNLPDFSGEGPLIGKDNKLYYSVSDRLTLSRTMLLVFDSNMNLLRTLDEWAVRATSTGMIVGPSWGSLSLVDAHGNLYYVYRGFTVTDPNGKVTAQQSISELELGHVYGVAMSAAGNLVFLVLMSSGFELREYSLQGLLIAHQPLSLTRMDTVLRQDPAGRYYVCDDSSVQSYDQQFNLLKTTTLISYNGQPYPCGDLWGVDSAGNMYVGSGDVGLADVVKFDVNGSFVFKMSGPHPVDPNAPVPLHVNGIGTYPEHLATDTIIGQVYVSQPGTVGSAIVVFADGKFKSSFSDQYGAYGLAVNSQSELYATSDSGLAVFDSSGTLLRTRWYPSVTLRGHIAIATDGSKYVLDGINKQIHVLDAADNYVRAIALSSSAADMALDPDGNLVVAMDGVVKKITPSGTELWSKNSGRISNLAVDAKGRIFMSVVGSSSMYGEIWDGSGTKLGSSFYADTMARGGDYIYAVANGRVYVLSAE